MKRTYNPSTIKRLRKFGFLKRKKNKKMLRRKRLKNKKKISIK
ncbi:MAG: 50S ribosomal protein L34 [Candidatus Shikimatogenerans bostrichidophilus]|nr:MAG: 50S ribosomal protein L34 [Candidatus Shikimatogenerans bostrichidophilus]